MNIRPCTPTDAAWITRFISQSWGAEAVIAHGVTYYPADLPGFIAEVGGEVAGLITYRVEGDACEIVTLDSLHEGRGIGSALIEAVKDAVREAGCRRLWLITTNDNLHALGFYQRRGFRLAALRPNAIAEARRRKPEIPLIGNDGIPIRDEIELETHI